VALGPHLAVPHHLFQEFHAGGLCYLTPALFTGLFRLEIPQLKNDTVAYAPTVNVYFIMCLEV
jgi:hypothetical protein